MMYAGVVPSFCYYNNMELPSLIVLYRGIFVDIVQPNPDPTTMCFYAL